MKVISIINQKGGVGKTTTAINLSSALGLQSKKVLIIDIDMQCNATTGLGVNNSVKNVYNIFLNPEKINDSIVKTNFPNIDIIPGSQSLSKIEQNFALSKKKETVLRVAVSHINNDYDYVIIDCPPSFNILSMNALICSDSILIPMQAEFYSIEGFSRILKVADLITKSWNKDLMLEGIVITMFDKRSIISHDIKNDIESNMGDFVYKTVIPRNIKIIEAQSHGLPIHEYDSSCAGSISYMNLAMEFLNKQ